CSCLCLRLSMSHLHIFLCPSLCVCVQSITVDGRPRYRHWPSTRENGTATSTGNWQLHFGNLIPIGVSNQNKVLPRMEAAHTRQLEPECDKHLKASKAYHTAGRIDRIETGASDMC